MGESKTTRATKNSQKVASLEEQNRVLEEVLKNSREAVGARNKEISPQGKVQGEGESSDKKRKASQSSGSSSPAKKAKSDGKPSASDPQIKVPQDKELRDNSEKRQILEYPDYEANRAEDFYESGREQLVDEHAGNQDTVSNSQRHGKAETSRRDHEVSSEEEDDIEEFEDPHDNVNEDFLGDEGAWDRYSIASSAIFPSYGKNKGNERPLSGAKPDAGRSRSKQESSGNSAKAPSATITNNAQGSNAIESLVKERAGVDQGRELVGPPIADCIADLLETYLKEPNAEAMLKLMESYPRPANAEWLQAPTIGTQVAASIPKRSNNYDKRLRKSQLMLGGSLAAMANVLQDIMNRGKEDPSLAELARKVMDAMALAGYVHFDFNGIRKGAIRQVVNPSYAGVFTRKTSSTPGNLLGESSVPDQLKEQDEISKVRAKLQKPRRSGSTEGRHDSARGRGRGFNPNNNNNNRGGFSNRNPGNYQGSGFGNFPRGGRGNRPGYPQQRRVYGQNHQNGQDHKNN